jgi:hypothetical protein
MQNGLTQLVLAPTTYPSCPTIKLASGKALSRFVIDSSQLVDTMRSFSEVRSNIISKSNASAGCVLRFGRA